MGPSAHIRMALPGDAAALALVGAATFLESFAGVLDGRDIVAHCRQQHAEHVYAGWLADDAFRTWLVLADQGDAPVGYLVLGRADLPLDDLAADDWEVKRLYLLGRFQGGGLGRKLVQLAEEQALRRGGRRLLLGVYGRNERAIAFYRHMGFTTVGTRTFRVGARQYDDLVLGLNLRLA
ncbi:MAG: GNAT family N-acetyltransferase [Planctomycetota bacterium]|nr:MAG: GNAT family N-acetyltransferase [Planctomycetota bacterium]